MDIKTVGQEAKKRFKKKNHISSLEGLMARDQNFLLEDLIEEQNEDRDDHQLKIKRAKSKNFSFIWDTVMEEKKLYFSGMVVITIAPLFHILAALSLKPLMEKGLTPKDLNQILFWGIIYVVFELFAFLLMWQGRRIMAKGSSLTLLSMRKKLFYHLETLPLSYLDRQPQGRIVTRVTHDVENLDGFFTEHLARFFASFVTIFIAIVAMVMTSPLLGFAMILSAFRTIVFLWKTRKRVDRANRAVSAGNSSVNSKLSEFISAIPVIRSYGLERWSIAEFEKCVERFMGAQLSANWVYSMIRPFASFFCSLPLITLIGFGGHLINQGLFALPLFLVFVRYYEIFYGPVIFLAHEVNVLQEALTSAERLRLFLLAPNESFDLGPDGQINSGKIAGHIVFQNVVMGYKQKSEVLGSKNSKESQLLALKGPSFEIKQGERVGLVGRTGCGKSTTVSLISRLYSYQQGKILIDDRPIEDYQRTFLRNQIGLVAQEAIIFKGTLRDNLYSNTNENLSREEIDRKIEMAQKETGLAAIMKDRGLTLDDFIQEAGTNLGQGEKQLIALTRILIRNPSILILDEATANIDPLYESIIQKAISKLMEGRTCLFIAHRLATLQDCHRLLVFRDGQLVESGSQKELIEKRGYFFELYINAEKNPNSSFEESSNPS